MGLLKTIGTILGDIHVVKALSVPPCFQIGEHKRQGEIANEYRAVTKVLRVGDIIVSRTWGYLSNILIQGAFKHAMVYTGPVSGNRTNKGYIRKPVLLPSGVGIHQTNSPRTVTHATSDGVICQDLLEVIIKCDYLCIFRPSFTSKGINDIGNIIAHEALLNEGKPYDFHFDYKSKKAMFCTELADYCCKKAGLPIAPKVNTRTIFGKRLVTYADFYFGLYPLVYVSPQCININFIKKSIRPNQMMTAMRMVQSG